MNKLLLQAIERSRTDFYAFTKLMAPSILPDPFADGPHIRVICDRLTAAESGESQRVMIEMPPRSMKSVLMSQLYPAWLFGRRPKRQLMHLSHTATLVDTFGRMIRNLIRTEHYGLIFPQTQISKDSRAQDKWHTTQGGVYASFGVGSPIAGFGGDPIIIDDAMSEQTAVSKLERQRIIDWYPQGCRSRLSPKGNMFIAGTRWTPDDLQGYLLKKMSSGDFGVDNWDVIRIPALLDAEGAKLLDLKEGASYWPERWPTEMLQAMKANMPPSQWAALYMQDPVAAAGNVFKVGQIKDWTYEHPPECEYIIISADTAYSTKETADFSAATVWGIWRQDLRDAFGRQFYLPHMILLAAEHGRWEFSELLDKLDALHRKFSTPQLQPTIIIENKASGQSLIQEMQRQGLPVVPWSPDGRGDKVARAWSVQPVIQSGRIWMPKERTFAQAVLAELESFPSADHDDYVDSMVQAISWMRSSYQLPTDIDPEEPTIPQRRGLYW